MANIDLSQLSQIWGPIQNAINVASEFCQQNETLVKLFCVLLIIFMVWPIADFIAFTFLAFNVLVGIVYIIDLLTKQNNAAVLIDKVSGFSLNLIGMLYNVTGTLNGMVYEKIGDVGQSNIIAVIITYIQYGIQFIYNTMQQFIVPVRIILYVLYGLILYKFTKQFLWIAVFADIVLIVMTAANPSAVQLIFSSKSLEDVKKAVDSQNNMLNASKATSTITVPVMTTPEPASKAATTTTTTTTTTEPASTTTTTAEPVSTTTAVNFTQLTLDPTK